MSLLLIVAFLFFIGSALGWILEVFYRRFFSKNNPERRWINPGFCVGPYVPLYGTGLAVLFLLAEVGTIYRLTQSSRGRFLMFVLMAVLMTAIEYLAGIMLIKWFHMRLWDYSKEFGNIQGLICPKFSAAWALLSAVYYYLIHPNVLEALYWLSKNLQFSFFIGLFFGFFIIDVVYSGNLVVKVKAFAAENDLIVHLEDVKMHIQKVKEENRLKKNFFLPLRTELQTLQEYLDTAKEVYEEKMEERRRY